MTTATQNKTIVGVFNSIQDAQEAIRDMEMEGISRSDISLVANKKVAGYESTSGMGSTDRDVPGRDVADNITSDKTTSDRTMTDKTSDVVADAGIGAAIGGVGGLLLSAAGMLTIPVIGPVLAAGPIAAALAGAGIGAAAGGLIGALTEAGIPEEDAKYFAEGVRRGDVLVTVKTDGMLADRAREIMDLHHAVNVNDRVSNWRERGWTGYDTNARPFSDDELRTERGYYGSEYSTSGERSGERSEERNVNRTGSSVERGAERTGEGIKDAGRAVKRGAARVYDRLT
jgi:uncharacterized membrane protein